MVAWAQRRGRAAISGLRVAVEIRGALRERESRDHLGCSDLPCVFGRSGFAGRRRISIPCRACHSRVRSSDVQVRVILVRRRRSARSALGFDTVIARVLNRLRNGVRGLRSSRAEVPVARPAAEPARHRIRRT